MEYEIEFPSIHRDGVKHGEEVWNPDPSKIVIKNPYPGSSPEGRDFYLGVVSGFRKAQLNHSLP